MSLTREEIEAINRRENGRVGLEVIDNQNRSYWITDVMPDERLRVVGEDGRAYWWNAASKFATPIPKLKREWVKA